MASIEPNSEYGYGIIIEKMNNLTNDIMDMLERGDISKGAAQHLLEQFSSIAKISDEYMVNAQDKDSHHSVSF